MVYEIYCLTCNAPIVVQRNFGEIECPLCGRPITQSEVEECELMNE